MALISQSSAMPIARVKGQQRNTIVRRAMMTLEEVAQRYRQEFTVIRFQVQLYSSSKRYHLATGDSRQVKEREKVVLRFTGTQG